MPAQAGSTKAMDKLLAWLDKQKTAALPYNRLRQETARVELSAMEGMTDEEKAAFLGITKDPSVEDDPKLSLFERTQQRLARGTSGIIGGEYTPEMREADAIYLGLSKGSKGKADTEARAKTLRETKERLTLEKAKLVRSEARTTADIDKVGLATKGTPQYEALEAEKELFGEQFTAKADTTAMVNIFQNYQSKIPFQTLEEAQNIYLTGKQELIPEFNRLAQDMTAEQLIKYDEDFKKQWGFSILTLQDMIKEIDGRK